MSPNRLPEPQSPVTILWLLSILCFGLGHLLPQYYQNPYQDNNYGAASQLILQNPARNVYPSLQIQRIPSAHRPQYQPRPLSSYQPAPLHQFPQVPSPARPQRPRPSSRKGGKRIVVNGFNNNTIIGNNAGNVNICVNGSGSGTGHNGEKTINFKGYNNNNVNGSFSGNVNNGHIYVNIDMGALNVSNIFSNKHFLKAIANITELRAEFLYKEIKRLQKLEDRNRLSRY